jgi:hypothetical protein
LYHRASLQPFLDLMIAKGFNFIVKNRVGNNAFFVLSWYGNKFHFDITLDYNNYVDWRIRESRCYKDELTYLGGSESLKVIKHPILLD